MKLTSIVIAALALAALSSAPAAAQNARSFVSGHGSDANFCTLASPCRNFARTLTTTKPGGEITVLDPAGYGTLTIDKAISIVNDGIGTASIQVPSNGNNSNTGIIINAGANDVVSLRGLTIEGGGVGEVGIRFNSGKSLIVRDSVIRNVTQDGIDFWPVATSSLIVSNTVASDSGSTGIFVNAGGSGAVTAVFNRVEVNNNGFCGIYLAGSNSTGTVKGTVSDSLASGNVFTAYVAQTAAGKAPTSMMLYRSVAANNGGGVYADGVGATIRLAQSALTANTVGWNGATGVVNSYGDNYIDGNNSFETAPTGVPRK